MKKIVLATLLIALTSASLVGCNKAETPAATDPSLSPSPAVTASIAPTETIAPTDEAISTETPAPTGTPLVTPKPGKGSAAGSNTDIDAIVAEAVNALPVIAEPASITVLVNKNFALPKSYEPGDLVYPDVPFIFKEKIDKRKMRSVAAEALEKMFAGAEKDDIQLAGASAYRSYATQKLLFNRYVKQDGFEEARTYSALPGTSEHETGLAIDVSGITGKCAAEDCFAGTKEAKWLSEHAAEYGFIIRYPKGKDAITGYKYEPWHLRYVGIDIAVEITDNGSTLENYLNAVPVSK
ncbi:D-alanyl-D-alanine carboxypeptidase family protein [Paenibacillus psychroresistens]|uniref:D-alanyl-D-alanine carboxypeptidase family protein n=1 Tax=Paenibacillus psychroresistens TaxID=1778678 RepID=A0A6B8RHQ9_9BACL|nr:M15 family metallopeptidase [Paenibacillus psychroresistens]QGQ95274.1 D-alanyl-D-alanine carboxypeptidase family protein [Paenibacillus psychroresistens]